jgi:NAD+ synthase (glutamine-hydrolysing)
MTVTGETASTHNTTHLSTPKPTILTMMSTSYPSSPTKQFHRQPSAAGGATASSKKPATAITSVDVPSSSLSYPRKTPSLITLATCNLNQWALDFDGNVKRILTSCQIAKDQNASYRLGPELEICGYGCEDHFLEQDTFDHCWESLTILLEEGASDGLLCDFGMPVLHSGVRYNCRVICYNRKVLLIRPKTAMADNGNYREGRYFTAYTATSTCPEKHLLPTYFATKFGQHDVPFGLHHLKCADGTTIGCESCEELWTPQSSHIDLSLRGVEIIGNGSGSHHELRKLSTRMELMVNATRKCGGVYLYSNQRGCDGGRTYYDGCAMIVVNGRIVAQAPQFDVHDVNVVSATVDLDDVRSYRASQPSFGIQAARLEGGEGSHGLFCDDIHMVFDPMDVSSFGKNRPKVVEEGLPLKIASPSEECCLGPACWLWDFLRRSGAAGFFLPLSGKYLLGLLYYSTLFISFVAMMISTKQKNSRYGHPINTER